ncbi:hypothetical protein JVU11DRAFT_8947 [Chiua virens]|nr:hypothetical protein JVU11DRAFT_8947 [Chiua virens]
MSNSLFSRKSQNIDSSQRGQQVSAALNEARAAFSAQHTEPDGVKFQEACGRLGQFLDFAIPMGQTEQITLVQILQLACAMHENAINDPELTTARRTVHRRASRDLTVVCNKARDNNILSPGLRWEVADLSYRAEQAFAKNFSRSFSKDNWAGYRPAAPSPSSAVSHLPRPMPSLRDIGDTRQAVQPKGFQGLPHLSIPLHTSLRERRFRTMPTILAKPLGRGQCTSSTDSGSGAGSNAVPSPRPVFTP